MLVYAIECLPFAKNRSSFQVFCNVAAHILQLIIQRSLSLRLLPFFSVLIFKLVFLLSVDILHVCRSSRLIFFLSVFSYVFLLCCLFVCSFCPNISGHVRWSACFVLLIVFWRSADKYAVIKKATAYEKKLLHRTYTSVERKIDGQRERKTETERWKEQRSRNKKIKYKRDKFQDRHEGRKWKQGEDEDTTQRYAKTWAQRKKTDLKNN